MIQIKYTFGAIVLALLISNLLQLRFAQAKSDQSILFSTATSPSFFGFSWFHHHNPSSQKNTQSLSKYSKASGIAFLAQVLHRNSQSQVEGTKTGEGRGKFQ
jgi:hypothetical protein